MRRRTFVGSLATVGLTAAAFDRPLGVNLYTVRRPLASEPAETYRALAAIGITTLEVRPANLLQHASMIRDAGLKPVHMFIDSAIVTGAWDEWGKFSAQMAARMKLPPPQPNAARPSIGEMIELAKRHGVGRIGISMILAGEREGAIDQMNAAGETCAAAGIELYYHNHAFEFNGPRGKRYIDQLHRRLSRRVRLELDVFWAASSGVNPAELILEWKGRVRSLHLKDVARGTPRPESEITVAPSAFAEVGGGTVDWPAVLKAARRAGVEHYLIEQDFTPGDPIDSVRRSFQFLRKLNV